jgi:hypothetical protein
MPKVGAHSHVRHKYLHDVAVCFFNWGGGGGPGGVEEAKFRPEN